MSNGDNLFLLGAKALLFLVVLFSAAFLLGGVVKYAELKVAGKWALTDNNPNPKLQIQRLCEQYNLECTVNEK